MQFIIAIIMLIAAAIDLFNRLKKPEQKAYREINKITTGGQPESKSSLGKPSLINLIKERKALTMAVIFDFYWYFIYYFHY